MPLSWNEIRSRAIKFSKGWEEAEKEKAESQSFWNDFFHVFGIDRRRVATFEKLVDKLGEKRGYIDLFWKGTLLVEQKSKGQNLNTAYKQALDYFAGLKEHELPKYIIVSDFSRFRLYDLDEDAISEFSLTDFHKNIHHFGFIAGYQKTQAIDEEPANFAASELLGRLHDNLLENSYSGHQLEVFLIRVLFCLFSDDTGIFEKNLFTDYIEHQTKPDGSNVGTELAFIFQVMNTPINDRTKNIDETINKFPFVNGDLFGEHINIPSFNTAMREMLLECCHFDWSKISPAIFGSLFQFVMNPDLRRQRGAHYTTEKNILRLIRPLFLDELYKEFNKIKHDKKKLSVFHEKIAKMVFLDPACGCGNFLVVTYRELRLLELKILHILIDEQALDIKFFSKVNIDSMYGIEIEEFPARIAEVAMWLVDHQMNIKMSEEFGQSFVRLPLDKSANIKIDNSMQIKWADFIKPDRVSFILGNPPFAGKQYQTAEQKTDLQKALGQVQSSGVLDYVAGWYMKAAEFIQNTGITVGFVSTNSITQGEQVGVLWSELFERCKIKIHFAHQTFNWTSEVRGGANVFVVIIGFAAFDIKKKRLFHYSHVNAEPDESKVSNINPYLVEGDDVYIRSRRTPICKEAPPISFGSMPNDGGHLLLSDAEKKQLLKENPEAKKYIRPLISAKEYLNNIPRWCLWLTDADPKDFKKIPELFDRIQKVKTYRLTSKRETTRSLAKYPALFGEIRQPETKFVAIPLNTSGHRDYIPISYFTKRYITNNSMAVISNCNLYHFGVLMSEMHMIWINYVCGRLKGDFRYSNNLVYNNFPWPDNTTEKKIEKVKESAGRVLDIRKEFAGNSLADLYDAVIMPPKLRKAHQQLDKAVDKCYGIKKSINESDRIIFLFQLYNKLVGV